MPNDNTKRTHDDTETYDAVIQPLIDKIGRVCRAFEIPFVTIFQPVTNKEEADVIRGQMFTPKHAAVNVAAAAFLLGADNQDDLSERIMRLAAWVMTRDVKGMGPNPMADLFAQMSESDDDTDKVLN